MNQKSVEKIANLKSTQPTMTCLGQLSISSIKEQHSTESSLDFEQEKHLLNQMGAAGLCQMTDQYGLQKPIGALRFLKKQNKDHHIELIRGNSQSRLHNFQNSEKNLCFNRQIKRKKISSKSKQKFLGQSSLLSTSSSLKQMRSSNNVQFHSRKGIEPYYSTETSVRPSIDVKSIAKCPRLALKIYEAPFDHSSDRDQYKSFKKIYHHLPDDFKIELNDLSNWHKQFDFNSKEASERKQQHREDDFGRKYRKQSRSLITVDLRRSRMSKPEESNNKHWQEASTRPAKRSEIYTQNDSKQVVQVSKPLSLDCKSSSFYSSRTEDYESPISKDTASTATRKVMKRSEFYRRPDQNCYGYFQPVIRTKNSNK